MFLLNKKIIKNTQNMDPFTFENFTGKNPVSGKNPDFPVFSGFFRFSGKHRMVICNIWFPVKNHNFWTHFQNLDQCSVPRPLLFKWSSKYFSLFQVICWPTRRQHFESLKSVLLLKYNGLFCHILLHFKDYRQK